MTLNYHHNYVTKTIEGVSLDGGLGVCYDNILSLTYRFVLYICMKILHTGTNALHVQISYTVPICHTNIY